mmetsp:Transcript_65349/g.200057  ORF Transcript_65349/g.200057 Transcript_65349/m.200057 type:complete len:215 (+) Transcript_65349:357-1001(+)
MFPNIQAEDWHHFLDWILQLLHERVVLVGRGRDCQDAIWPHAQPRPTASKAAHRRLFKLGLHVLHAPETIVDGRLQIRLRLCRRPAGGRQIHPEERVVVVPPAVVPNSRAETWRACLQARQRRGPTVKALHGRGVQPGNVGGMVLVVMDLHGLRVDVRFQRVIRVRQRGERELGADGPRQRQQEAPEPTRPNHRGDPRVLPWSARVRAETLSEP